MRRGSYLITDNHSLQRLPFVQAREEAGRCKVGIGAACWGKKGRGRRRQGGEDGPWQTTDQGSLVFSSVQG